MALVTGNVSQAAIDTLRGDGWRVRQVATVHNPGRWTQPSRHKFPARFHAVYTKLLIFNMTEYERGAPGGRAGGRAGVLCSF